MSDAELMSIGSFAQRCGLTASALRFYADSGSLLPAVVDPVTGYRFYREDQLAKAVLLRRLREIGMSLPSVNSALDADVVDVIRFVDDHVTTVMREAESVRQQAAAITSALAERSGLQIARLSGPVLASAIEQILTATIDDPDIAVLGGVHVEAGPGALTVTASDRYRLSTRTLVSHVDSAAGWAATVNGDDLRQCLGDLRGTSSVSVDVTDHGMTLRLIGRGDHHCRFVSEPFPDYRSMLDSLPAVTCRVEVPTGALLHALEQRSSDRVRLCSNDNSLVVRGHSLPDIELPARVNGSAIDVWFEMTTLYPAISTAVGADVMLDFRGCDQPATVRSADRGDLTTLVMPIAAPRDTTTKGHRP
ncbi:MerR family transcriptional regulator [Rhodococcus sp. BP-149]|uniref:MerR family transcriptional regulator n=1 Tax=unclassified Rhodococcus (in: high G+C Gram-positive bacteria) TaxID=192944 RepID=UPI001D911713|nr:MULTISPECIES: MerR family transcriptional regulator [unclassified Rhodococcus (in: high G+C Gram-positive bacteria)]MBY6687204.1 MerR family transcriptional regulator [Rhodococcus sp. BP-288]MBY6694373.1 MerR family transcriptional regulator [Rhodococcus sp. BP-188]MBY6698082.1 MerR family transcriptional regulator [Rhodococcus sp. BP-285]MBY6704302.1 MerR family transcriptional regulator [Rhodococcus sp. BP-283]MBY6712951.1 MerR family transcriptional regulator [Rhodococcus sp. BP-160]